MALPLSASTRRTGVLGLSSLLLSLAALLASPAAAQVPTLCEEQRILPASLAPEDGMGWETAAGPGRAVFAARSDDTLGTDSGSVYSYVQSAGQWVLEEQLFSSTPEDFGIFGHGIALDGNRLAVGAPKEAAGGLVPAGAVHVFVHDGSSWQLEQRVVPDLPEQTEWFGSRIGLDGDRMAVGAPFHDVAGESNAGVAYVFERIGGTWMQRAQLESPEPDDSGLFGATVALEGDTLFVGAYTENAGRGVTYVFEFDGASWNLTDELVPFDPHPQWGWFGFAIDLHGDRAAIGSTGANTTVFEAGAVYLYRREPGGWTFEQKVWPSDAGNSDRFGGNLALSDDQLVVGAQRANNEAGSDAGALYLFELGGGSWTEVQRVLATDAQPGYEFGSGVARAGDLVVVGSETHSGQAAEGGAGYVMRVAELYEVYCSSSPNSTGFPARISASGSSSVTANDLTLRAFPVPDQPGLFYYGPAQASVPFGNGTRCVDGPFERLPIVAATANALELALDNEAPPNPSGQLLPGSTWYFQAWYRDPAGGAAMYDLSDAMAVTFCP